MNLFSDYRLLRRAWPKILLMVSIMLLSGTAHGLSVVPRSFDELVQRAGLVLVGTVRDVRSEFADGGLNQNSIQSYVSFSDLQVIKGQVTGEEYVLRVPGGVVGRFAQDYPGIPSFQTGQRYLVFIRGNQRDFFPVVGITQGVFRIIDNNKGQHVVVRDDHVGRASQRALAVMTQSAPTLDAFIQRIHSRMADGVGDPQP
jgi:hypothetical protein